MRKLSVPLSLVVLGLMIAGCGGSNLSIASNRKVGKATLKVVWPARNRLIPNAANSLTVTLSQSATQVAQKVIARPASGSTTTSTTFTNLPYGGFTVGIQAFPNSDGTGNPQAQGTGAMTVTEDVPGTVTVSLDSTVAALSLSTVAKAVPGGTAKLVASATDSKGNVVLLSAGGGQETITWSCDTPGVATIAGTGPTATLTGVTAGTAHLTETMKVKDDGTTVTSGPLEVDIIDRRLALTGYPKAHGDVGDTGRGGGAGAVGNIAWTTSVGSVSIGAIVVRGDGVVFASSGGTVSALDTGGNVLWQHTVTGSISGLALTNDGLLYVGGNLLTALNSTTGNVVWTFTTDTPCYEPTIDANGTIYVGTSGSVYAVNPFDQSVFWHKTSVVGNRVLVLSATQVLLDGPSLDTIIDSTSGATLYTLPSGTQAGAAKSSTTSIGQVVYVEADVAVPTGSGPSISQNADSYTCNSSSATLNWSTVFGGNYNGTDGGVGLSPAGTFIRTRSEKTPDLVLAFAQGTTGPKWTDFILAQGGPSFGSNGVGYLATRTTTPGTVVAFNPETGATNWTATLPAGASSTTPAIGADGTVYAGTSDGRLVAIR